MRENMDLASHFGAAGPKGFKSYSGGKPLKRETDMQICTCTSH